MKSNKLEEFRDWIETARTGQIFIYHTGFLAVDRGNIVNFGDADIVLPNEPVNTLATLAINGFDAGKLHLFQRKLHDGVYQYIAMKKSPYGRRW